ncbi:MAG: phage holin family protein [Candidatus Dasytiphilus stammeri]
MKQDKYIGSYKKGLISISQQIIKNLINIIETRIILFLTELHESKNNILNLLMMIGFTILFFAFGLISLLLVIISIINPKYRLLIMTMITIILFLIGFSLCYWTLFKINNTKLFSSTYKEFKNDIKIIKEE